MIVTGHEAFLLTLFFVVTGYITHSVAARFTFRRSERPELLLLRFLAYGTANALISFLVVVQHTKVLPRETWAGILAHNLSTYYGLAVWVLFLIPAILGVLLGAIAVFRENCTLSPIPVPHACFLSMEMPTPRTQERTFIPC